MYRSLRKLRRFRARSRVVQMLMIAASVCALGSAFLLSGEVGVVSFVAFLNFTAGLWIAQMVHSLGDAVETTGYGDEAGTATAESEATAAGKSGLLDEVAWAEFLRIAVVIAFAASVFVFTATEILSPQLSIIAIGAIGAIALLTAMMGFLIAAASTLDHAEDQSTMARAAMSDGHDNRDDEGTSPNEER